MRIHLSDWNGIHEIVSVARSQYASDKLKNEGLSHWLIMPDGVIYWPGNKALSISSENLEQLLALGDYDVIEVREDGTIIRLYQDNSTDNIVFITERCNSNCIMCPSPTSFRRKGFHVPVKLLLAMIEHIPSDAVHLTITGGEPFLIGKDIFSVFAKLKEHCDNTEILILTNGRALAVKSYQDNLLQTIPDNTMFGIPIHASSAKMHDMITQVPGSFQQTIAGLDFLLCNGMCVEIRIVVSRINVYDLPSLATMIAERFPSVAHVSIMAMEMTGSAHENRKEVWIPYRESFQYVSTAVEILVTAGINTRLYNYPLCTVEPKYWPLCKKSISPEKIRYSNVCEDCKIRSSCGGVFGGTLLLEKAELEPVI